MVLTTAVAMMINHVNDDDDHHVNGDGDHSGRVAYPGSPASKSE